MKFPNPRCDVPVFRRSGANRSNRPRKFQNGSPRKGNILKIPKQNFGSRYKADGRGELPTLWLLVLTPVRALTYYSYRQDLVLSFLTVPGTV